MKTTAPLQIGNLLKTIAFLFFGLLILWALISYLMLREVYLHWVLLVFNLLLSIALGWRFYKSNYHTTFAYDQDGFEIERGDSRLSARWRDYSRVSLVHLGLGESAVRLYKDGDDFLQIPVSSLKLDPSEFRFQVMEFVKGQERGPDLGASSPRR
ncbi:MAG: TMEM14 family protein [Anaerolineae bacterium]